MSVAVARSAPIMSDASDLESWDSDPDFDLPPEGIRLPLPLPPSEAVPPASSDHDGARDFLSLLDSKLSSSERRARDKGDSVDSLASVATTGSTVSSAGTLRGGAGGGGRELRPDDQSVDVVEHEVEQDDEHKSSNRVAAKPTTMTNMQTIRLGSDLSKLLSGSGGFGPNGKRKVSHLGSARAIDVGEGDWDQDLDFGDVEGPGDQTRGTGHLELAGMLETTSMDGKKVAKKASWASHLSLDDGDARDDANASSSRKDVGSDTNDRAVLIRQKVSIDSFRDDPAESDEVSDLDFDLPSTQSTFGLSPSLSLENRPSLTSLRSEATSDHPRTEPSTASIESASTQVARSVPLPLSITPAPSRLSLVSIHSNTTTTTTDDEDGSGPGRGKGGRGGAETGDESDPDFFQDLELPAYFLGTNNSELSSTEKRRHGGGTTTPPTSDGEFSFSETSPSPTKATGSLHGFDREDQVDTRVDLQSLLKQKLETRGGRGLLFRTSSGSSTTAGGEASPTQAQLEGLQRHREREDEEHEAGRELSLSHSSTERAAKGRENAPETGTGQGEEWNADEMRKRMRTVSGVRAREAAMARASRPNSARRRPTSIPGGKPQPLPSTSTSTTTSGIASRLHGPGRSEKTPIETSTTRKTIFGSGLSRSGSSARVASQPDYPQSSRSSQARTTRPSSAQSAHGSTPSTSSAGSVRRGPPPAPSTASRDRIRLRTISLRTVGSHSDVRTSSSSTRERRSSVASSDRSEDGVSTIRTRHPSRTASSPGPTASLRPRRSQQQLRPSTIPMPERPTIQRQRSLQNLASADGGSSRTSSRDAPLNTSSTIVSISRQPSFAAPTAASASRSRPRVHSNPPPLAAIPASPVPSRNYERTAAESRLRQATLASAGKSRQTPTYQASLGTPSRSDLRAHVSALRIPSQPVHLSRPLGFSQTREKPGSSGARESYGDGTELDGFDDLPVSKDREKAATLVVGRPRNLGNRSNTPTTAGQGLGGVKPSGPLTVKGSRGRDRVQLVEAKERGVVRSKKREPHLIRHLGGTQGAPKVQGEMTYNPTLQRWEGNESILREFDHVLSSSTRPALISPFSSTLGVGPGGGSPAHTIDPANNPRRCRRRFDAQPIPTAGPSRSDSEPRTGRTLSQLAEPFNSLPPPPPFREGAGGGGRGSSAGSRGGVKVVGDMVFDPKTCSWFAVDGPDAEDELELDWGDVADDEHGGEGEGADTGTGMGTGARGDGWEKGERERMLKNRASFVLSEGEDASSDEEGLGGEPGRKGRMTKRGIWRESKRAEERCREEMKGWITHVAEGDGEDKSWLFELRALVMDSK